MKLLEANVGLTSDVALARLLQILEEFLASKRSQSCLQILQIKFRHHTSGRSIFCAMYIILQWVLAVALLIAATLQDSFETQATLLIATCVILLVSTANVLLMIYLIYCECTEVLRKTRVTIHRLQKYRDYCGQWSHVSAYYPDLNIPSSECIQLQWTFRDNKLVNLPRILLVEGDFILLRPGSAAPCKCRAECDGRQVSCGEVFNPTTTMQVDSCSVRAFEPLLCRVLETPALKFVEKCLTAGPRPPSVFDNEVFRAMHYCIERFVLPLCIILTLMISSLRLYFAPVISGHWCDMLLTIPTLVVLPLSAIVFPLYWLLVNVVSQASVLSAFVASKRVKHRDLRLTDSVEMFSENAQSSSDSQNGSMFSSRSTSCYRKLLCRLILGDSKYLPITANLVHTLANITSLAAVDKKGVLSWPNPTPEKLFFFLDSDLLPFTKSDEAKAALSRSKHPSQTGNSVDADTDAGTVEEEPEEPKQSRLSSHVLDLTHDPEQAFLVQFDDPAWKMYLSSLKPLGLNILLNSCAYHADFLRFHDHLSAVSQTVPRTLMVNNRRCLCLLPKIMGFDDTTVRNHFDHLGHFCVYRKTPGELPLPGFARHRIPFTNCFCVQTKDRASGHMQVFAQGTADLLCDACSYLWDGKAVVKMSKQQRRKIADFYHRSCMTSYCVALTYAPTLAQIDPGYTGGTYVEWKYEKPITGHFLERAESIRDRLESFKLEQKRVLCDQLSLSQDSLLSEDAAHLASSPGRSVQGGEGVLREFMSNHVFLGLISMQYQAKPDVVRLCEHLDRACIRFVQFSKENEVRSRVFAEKLGLETGWNCHISLAGEDDLSPDAVVASTTTRKWSRNHVSKNVRHTGRHMSLPVNAKLSCPLVRFRNVPDGRLVSPTLSQGEEARAPLARLNSNESQSNSPMDSIFGDDDDDVPIADVPGRFSRMERAPLLSDTTSQASGVTSQSSVALAVPYFISNQAKLPKGVANVRPHLEHVDNVPLLVPLFTDCTPETNCEMIKIMQEYGEVVCCVGSSLNCDNAETFLQANCSICVEPMLPAICVSNPGVPKRAIKGPLAVAGLIASLPCSLSITAGEQISLLQLIAESRRWVDGIRVSLLFLLNSCAALSVLQLLSLALLMPPPLNLDHTLWLVCFVLPLLGAVLCVRQSDGDLEISTAKNVNHLKTHDILAFCRRFVVKVLPSLVVCLFLYKSILWHFCSEILGGQCALMDLNPPSNGTGWAPFEGPYLCGIEVAQSIVCAFLVLYFSCMSLGYVHYRRSLWTRLPFRNSWWVRCVLLVLVMQVIYSVVEVEYAARGVSIFKLKNLPLFVPILGFSWTIPLVGVNELWKRKEIKLYARDQRRRRLSFNTKLGMNSPF